MEMTHKDSLFNMGKSLQGKLGDHEGDRDDTVTPFCFSVYPGLS